MVDISHYEVLKASKPRIIIISELSTDWGNSGFSVGNPTSGDFPIDISYSELGNSDFGNHSNCLICLGTRKSQLRRHSYWHIQISYSDLGNSDFRVERNHISGPSWKWAVLSEPALFLPSRHFVGLKELGPTQTNALIRKQVLTSQIHINW